MFQYKLLVDTFKKNPHYPEKALFKKSGFQFYNTSDYTLQELCNDADYVATNFKAYIAGFSANVQDILRELEMEQHINKMDKDGCLYSVVKAFSELDLSPRACLKNAFCQMCVTICGRFVPNEGRIAGYVT